jgi:hypothetical protein
MNVSARRAAVLSLSRKTPRRKMRKVLPDNARAMGEYTDGQWGGRTMVCVVYIHARTLARSLACLGLQYSEAEFRLITRGGLLGTLRLIY